MTNNLSEIAIAKKHLTAAIKAALSWNGADVTELFDAIAPLSRSFLAANATPNDPFDDFYDDYVELIEALNDRSIWPAPFTDEICEFAIASDPNKYITWENAPDSAWWKHPLTLEKWER